MSKFAYKAEGELNSQYVLDLIKEYLSKLLESNDTKGILDNDYKINPNANCFIQWFSDITARLFKSNEVLENYNKVLTTKYVNSILDKIEIYLQTNVLNPKQFFELTETLKTIKFDKVIPLLELSRENSITSSQKNLLKILKDIKYLNNASSNYILYNSPVPELKPFLSERVSAHTINYKELQKLVRQFVELRYTELTTFNFEPYKPIFIIKEEIYASQVTDNGVGEDVEAFIRGKMIEKLNILKQEEILPEVLQEKVSQIDSQLKYLKLHKIEQMLQQLVELQINIAKVKQVIDNCKETINSTTYSNKSQIFLLMDDLYYRLSQKAEKLTQKVKLKLQLVDKSKVFSMIETMQDENYERNNKGYILHNPKISNKSKNTDDKPITSKPHIASNLYDDDDTDEIHIIEDDGEVQAEDEIVIDE